MLHSEARRLLVEAYEQTHDAQTVATLKIPFINYPAHRDTSQVHFDESFLHTAFTPAIPLYNGRFKRDSLQAGHMERNIARGGGKVSAVVTTAVPLASLISLIPGCLIGPCSDLRWL